uniref:Atherin-like n=1 Tax=Poecilia formosa TaxID=48698 RepID=A0A087X9A1_POEFO
PRLTKNRRVCRSSLTHLGRRMSESKYREWILDTIDSLRSRKARPDLERICRMVRRRHGSEPDRTCAELEKLIQEQTVLKVNYKGSISYRNAAKVQRRSRKKDDVSLATAARRSAMEEASHSDLSNGDSAFGAVDQDEEDLEGDTSMAMDTDSNPDEEGAEESRDGQDRPSPSPQREGASVQCAPIRAASAPCSPSGSRPGSGPNCSAGSALDCAASQKPGERPNSLPPSSPAVLTHNGKDEVRNVSDGRLQTVSPPPENGECMPSSMKPIIGVVQIDRPRKIFISNRTDLSSDDQTGTYSVQSFGYGYVDPRGHLIESLKPVCTCLCLLNKEESEKVKRNTVDKVLKKMGTKLLLRTSRLAQVYTPSEAAGAKHPSSDPEIAMLLTALLSESCAKCDPVGNPDEEGAEESRDGQDRPSPSPQREGASVQCAPIRAASAPCSPSGSRPGSGPNCSAGSALDCAASQKPVGTLILFHHCSMLQFTVFGKNNEACFCLQVRCRSSRRPTQRLTAVSSMVEQSLMIRDSGVRRSTTFPTHVIISVAVCGCVVTKCGLPPEDLEDSGLSRVDGSVKLEKMNQNLLQWTVADVASYFSAAGFPEQAVAFRTQEIDGKSLLLMQRSDVLTGLSIRLGPALKIYERHVKVLQRTHFLECDDI